LLALASNSARRDLSCERYGSTISSGSSTFCSVVRHGSSVGAWNAMPTILSGPATSRPSMTTVPRVGRLSPGGELHEVDLPQPEGPTIAMNSPSPVDSVMSSTAKSLASASSSL
jgi:hypothetical protein